MLLENILEAVGKVDRLGGDVVIESTDETNFGDRHHHLFLPVLER